MQEKRTYTAFAGDRLIFSGELTAMLRRAKACLDAGETGTVLVFEDQTGKQVDFDFRGTAGDVAARIAEHPHFASQQAPRPRKGPGRPYLGVVGGEVSLLPRHWDWLGRQPGGISATLRRLVDDERKRGSAGERAREAWDAAGKFMWAMCGNLPGFEEASRALYAHDVSRLDALIQEWPPDIRDHLRRLALEAARLEQEAAARTGRGGV
ncbi:MAG: DUF2239 family protein [Candidatus Hydrogenedentes bacterium]|nr:DUF2239 family protein [Candidatus Hydrogenedentota bacterium]